MAKREQKERVSKSAKLQRWVQAGASTCYMMLLFAQPAAAADTMWTRFSTIIADVYGQLVGISTIVAVTAAAVALLVRMISRNERAVAEATSWLKRIVVTWIVLNTLGFVVAYLQPLIQGGNYTP
ncbi:MAG: fimbrial protein [Muribaculaceae bacterium]|nr:fimbrial protein [Muribaculaceae bacterium]